MPANPYVIGSITTASHVDPLNDAIAVLDTAKRRYEAARTRRKVLRQQAWDPADLEVQDADEEFDLAAYKVEEAEAALKWVEARSVHGPVHYVIGFCTSTECRAPYWVPMPRTDADETWAECQKCGGDVMFPDQSAHDRMRAAHIATTSEVPFAQCGGNRFDLDLRSYGDRPPRLPRIE